MGFDVAGAFRDGVIDHGEALQIYQKANPHRTLKAGDDHNDEIAKNIAAEISTASKGKVSQDDAMGVARTIVKELYESAFQTGDKKFDNIPSPFSPASFNFPVKEAAAPPAAMPQPGVPASDKEIDEFQERKVAANVSGRDVKSSVADLQDPAKRKAFLEKCPQLDGEERSTIDRASCTVMSVLGGYILANPAAFQTLGQKLKAGELPEIPGFAELRGKSPLLQGALENIAKGEFSPMDVNLLMRSLAHVSGLKAPDYDKGGASGNPFVRTAVILERFTAIGAPPPDGLEAVSVGSDHQVGYFGGNFFDSGSSTHDTNGHLPYHATVSPNLNHRTPSTTGLHMVSSDHGQTLTFTSGPNDVSPTVLKLKNGQYEVQSGDLDGRIAKILTAQRQQTHPPAKP